MHQCCGADECVPLGPSIWNVQRRTTPRDGCIDRQGVALKGWKNVTLQPFPQNAALNGVPAFQAQDTILKFQDRDG